MKQKVYDFLLNIPSGKVSTYGEIAAALGNKNLARVVGNILHQNPNPKKYPCHRVVNSKGELAKNFAFGGLVGQKEKLESEGVEVINGKVDLNKFGYKKESNLQ